MRIAIALALAACSSDPPPAKPDAAPQPDAPPNATCLVDPSYTLGAIIGETNALAGGTISGTFTINPGPPRDTFFLKLTGIGPGSYAINGSNADYNTCTLCVNVIADIVTGQGPTKFYQAQSGTVMLTSTTTTSIAGSVSNLVFREIQIEDGAVIGTCTTTIASADFTATP